MDTLFSMHSPFRAWMLSSFVVVTVVGVEVVRDGSLSLVLSMMNDVGVISLLCPFKEAEKYGLA